MKLKYKNYIFDLYGTLVDIHTDENDNAFWSQMTKIYSAYGADYKPEQMQQQYFDLCREEEQELSFKMCINYPEIKIETVLYKLLINAPAHHACMEKVAAMQLEDLEKSEWVKVIANTFRALSRKKLKLFPHTISTLKTLKENGGKIYLLSNAQHLFTMAELEEAGLMDYFDAIYISSDEGMRKPQPQFMKKLLQEQECNPEESIMVGNDFQSDIGVSASCKVDSIFLNTDKLSLTERKARMKRIIDDHFEGYRPYIIESGDIKEMLSIVQE